MVRTICIIILRLQEVILFQCNALSAARANRSILNPVSHEQLSFCLGKLGVLPALMAEIKLRLSQWQALLTQCHWFVSNTHLALEVTSRDGCHFCHRLRFTLRIATADLTMALDSPFQRADRHIHRVCNGHLWKVWELLVWLKLLRWWKQYFTGVHQVSVLHLCQGHGISLIRGSNTWELWWYLILLVWHVLVYDRKGYFAIWVLHTVRLFHILVCMRCSSRR